MSFKIYLSPPNMGGDEIKYVQEAFDTNWIAPYGPSINAFEQEMAEYIGVNGALALTSGTAAIHLALRWFGVQQGDYVFCSDFTFIGSCNAILYEKAVPVFIDSEPDSWNMSPIALEKAFLWAKKQNKLPKAVIIVDLYGESADWSRLLPICNKYHVPVIEDSAEAAGTEYRGKRCGCFGDVSILSFNGNKIITTSGGGMALSNDPAAIDKMRFWSTQAREPYIHYEHKEYGYNYRMSNICAAIGRGQLKYLDHKIVTRKKIHDLYAESLSDIPAKIKTHAQGGGSNYWLSILTLDTDRISPSDIVEYLLGAQIESRPTWKPMHMQPLFKGAVSFMHDDDRFLDEDIFSRSVCLPSGDGMTMEQQQMVVEEILKGFEKL